MPNTSTVTILFTDVVGSVELRTSRGDESAHQIMRAHFELVRPYIERFSGQEVKTIGDSFMVAFGSARSAVDCAVAVQHALAEHNHNTPNEQIHVRMGMNTGEAIQEEGDLFGTAVDAAARVMSKAAGGQILIPESTREALGEADDIPLFDRGPYWLKGFPERWRLYEVLWHEEKISTAAVLPHIGRQTPFVGRESERADLRRFLERAKGGYGSLVMIGGEPGVGKTRITEELAAEADRHGFLTLTGHCYEMEGGPPYIPFIEILQFIMRMVEQSTLLDTLGSAAPEAAKLVPELRERFPDIPEPRKLAPEQERLYLFKSLCDFFERLGSRRPLLLVLEDLHWADESTMLLLQHLAQQLGQTPLLAVGTYRDTELDVARSLARASEELLRQRLAHDIILKRLPEADVVAMLQKHSQQKPPTCLVELVYRETDGNPFFVEEIFKYFTEEGRLFDDKGRWRSDIEIGEAEVPRGVKLVIGRRLERVSEQCRHTLTSAAIIGRAFGFDLLEVLVDLDENSLFDAIEEAEQAQLIRSQTNRGGARFIFSHELIRQTLVGGFSLPRRQRAHLRVAESLERLHAGALEEHSADLAYHYYQAAGDPEKIIDYSVMAAERAAAQTAYEEAVAQYQRALQTLELQKPIDGLRRCDLLVALGHAYGHLGDPQKAKDIFLRVTDIARKLPASAQFAEAVLGICRFWYWGGFIDNRILNLMNEGLALLGEQDSPLRASLLGRLVWFLESTGEERRIALGEQAVATARRVGDPKALYYALWGRAFTWDLPLPERIGAATELAELEKSVVLPDGQHRGLFYLCYLHWMQGDMAASDAALTALRELVTETSHPTTTYVIACAECLQPIMQGRFEDAKRLTLEALALGQKVNEEFAAQTAGVVMYILRWLQGRLAQTDETTRRVTKQNPQFRDTIVHRASKAHFLLMLGRKERARKEYEQLAANDFSDLPRNWSMPLLLVHLSEVAVALADTRRIDLLYDLMRPLSDYLLMVGFNNACLGSTGHWLGLLAGTMQQWDEATAHFEDAIKTNSRIGARPFLARSQHEYARMLIERNELDDKEKAKELLSEATATYRELGMPTFLKDAEALLKKL